MLLRIARTVFERHKETISFRAIATSRIRRIRPLVEPTRSWNQRVRARPG
jgi:hypothetical protein